MNRRHFLAGTAAMSTLGFAQAEAAEGLQTRMEGGDLLVSYGGRPLLRYRRDTVQPPAGADPLLAASGYIHPLHAPCGVVVTNHYSPDHLHQRGVFSAWTKTRLTLNGEELHPDFWNIQEGTGRVRSVGVEPVSEAGRTLGFRAKHISEARVHDGWEPVLDEVWDVRFPRQRAGEPNAADAAYLVDITSRQTPRHTLVLEKYHYGGMAVRGSGQWAKGSDMTVLNSEGKDRAGSDQTPARWIDMSGTVDGRQAGIALLEHPSNLHAPNGVRMHPDMPYYVFALPESGPVTLEVGREYVFRYRLVAHNGRVNAETLSGIWREFSGEQ